MNDESLPYEYKEELRQLCTDAYREAAMIAKDYTESLAASLLDYYTKESESITSKYVDEIPSGELALILKTIREELKNDIDEGIRDNV